MAGLDPAIQFGIQSYPRHGRDKRGHDG